jgi:AcrR family transcriptional regulator
MSSLSTQDVLLVAAERLLEEVGLEGVTTRAVCEVADVKAPTLYHHFSDKNGLLDALVARGVEAFLTRKRAMVETDDPVADLVAGFEDFLGFALDRPRLFRLMVQRVGDNPQVIEAAMASTNVRLTRLAEQGRLRTEVVFARRAMMALSNGVTSLCAQGASNLEVQEVGRFMLQATLKALVRR